MSDMQNQQDPKALIKKVLAPIAEDMAAVDAVIRSELASDVPRMKEISEYITSAGGKRMRPALLMLICRALGYEGTLHQYLGATIELLHTATLMHDDVVDESDMRRGRPTANSRWGNGAAVLVGDFLYTRSFQMMVKAGNLRVMEALSDAANRLSEGEVVQMVNAQTPAWTKPATSASLSARPPAFSKRAHAWPPPLRTAVLKRKRPSPNMRSPSATLPDRRDVLDYRGNAVDTGKNLGADLREGKVTLPIIYARESCTPEERAHDPTKPSASATATSRRSPPSC